MKIVIGCDPDANKHGIAVYTDGKLAELLKLDCVELVDLLTQHITDKIEVLVSMENVLANNFIYARNKNSNRQIENTIALRVGRCQQSQTEVMRWLDRLEVPYVLHNPTKNNWAKNKKYFEKMTGWDKQSNEDTRAASYFAFLEVNR